MATVKQAKLAKVLIVDDSKLMRVAIKRLLLAEFYIIEAVDGLLGWEQMLVDDQISVVITDACMPRLDGYGLIQRARKHTDSRINKLPIIMITGAEDAQARDRALEVGATDFIVKPPEKAQLLARVRANAKATNRTRELEAESLVLAAQATLEPVTQLTSKRYLLTHGAQDMAFAKRHGNDITFIGIGVDHIQRYKKDHQDSVIDNIVKFVAQMLRQSTRAEDTLSVVAQGRFAIVTPSTGRVEAGVLCERIRKRVLANPYKVNNIAIPLSVSIGLVSLINNDLANIEACLEAVFRRVDMAQRSGGNRLISSEPKSVPRQKSRQVVSDVNVALEMLKNGQAEQLTDSLPVLVGKIWPLLALAGQHYRLGIEGFVAKFRAKLTKKRAELR